MQITLFYNDLCYKRGGGLLYHIRFFGFSGRSLRGGGRCYSAAGVAHRLACTRRHRQDLHHRSVRSQDTGGLVEGAGMLNHGESRMV